MLIYERSYEVNSLTERTNLRLMCDRNYEVSETIDFSEDIIPGINKWDQPKIPLSSKIWKNPSLSSGTENCPQANFRVFWGIFQGFSGLIMI